MSTRSFGPDDGLPALPPELDPRGRRRRHGSSGGNSRRSLARGAMVLCTVLSMLCLVGFGYGWWNYRKLNNNLQRLNIAVGAATTGGGGVSGTPQHDIDGKDENILIAGNDDRNDMTDAEVKQLHTGRDGGSEATDSMMIVHIPANGAKATLISLPRDSWVSIPGYGMNKLNAAYALAYSHAAGSANAKIAAGANLLVETVHNLTGLTIDHFVQVDLIGFYRISEAIGGVPVNLCHAVDDTVAYNEAHGQGDAGSGFHMSAGKHDLTAVQTLEFVRQRHNLPGGDLDRIKRQQYFLTTAFRKIASAGVLLNPGKLNSLISAVDKSIYVDKNLNLTTLAGQLSNLSANNIIGKTIPTTAGTINGLDVFIVSPTAVKTFIGALINSDNSALDKANLVEPSTVTVNVINGGTVNGAAAQNAATLQKDGFQTTVDQQGASSTSTIIEYAGGMESQAKTLAAYVPGATYQQVNSVSQVTLLLGADGLGAKLVASSSAPTTSTTPKPKAIDSHCID